MPLCIWTLKLHFVIFTEAEWITRFGKTPPNLKTKLTFKTVYFDILYITFNYTFRGKLDHFQVIERIRAITLKTLGRLTCTEIVFDDTEFDTLVCQNSFIYTLQKTKRSIMFKKVKPYLDIFTGYKLKKDINGISQ